MKKILALHPDALYDSAYENIEIETEDYSPCKMEYKGEFKTKNGVTVLTTGGNCIILESCFENTIRFRITKAGAKVEPTVTEKLGLINTAWGDIPFEYAFEENLITFSNAKLTFTFDIASGNYKFADKKGKILLNTKNGGANFSKNSADYSGLMSMTVFERGEDERFFGFGARMYAPDRTGESADIFSEKGGTKTGDYGGFPIPYFISSRGYGFFFNNPWPHVYFDMAKTAPDEWFINAPGGDYDIFVFAGETAPQIIKSYTAIVGRNQLPDKWLMGYWCSSIRFDEAENAIEDMSRMRAEGYPCDAIVIDGPWRGGKNFIKDYSSGWGYPSDDYNWSSDFGDGQKMIKTLEKQGIKTVLHINSCAFKKETAVPAIAQGLLRQVNSETVPDVCSDRGIEFYKKFLVPRINDGVRQWWTDHSDRVSGEIAPGIPSRNLFGVLWNKVISETMSEHNVKRHMALSRGGGIGSQRYALPWAGDTEFGIHRFLEDIWYVINAGMAGFTLSGYDLGGFMRKNKKEGNADEQQFDIDNICRRVCQSMIFCPMPRMHNGDSARPKWPWNCPKETRELYKECLTFRYRFIPNIFSYAINGSRTGEPIIRPLFYNDIKDTKLYGINDEFFLGKDILIAPVVEKGALSRTVYLPKGNWVNLWTGEQHEGEKNIECECPMYKKEGLPVFVRVGGGIAFQTSTMYLTNECPRSLKIQLYADDCAKLILNEGENITNEFSCTVSENSITVYAQNNSSFLRQYEFCIYHKGKEYKTKISAASGTVFREEIKL